MIDKVCWQQDDFEIVLEAQDRLAAILHNFSGPRQSAGRPHLSRDERLRQWERDLGSLPVWMGYAVAQLGQGLPQRIRSTFRRGWLIKNILARRGRRLEAACRADPSSFLSGWSLLPGALLGAQKIWRYRHANLEARFWSSLGVATMPWSLFGPETGNLLDLEVQAFWKSQIHQGRVHWVSQFSSLWDLYRSSPHSLAGWPDPTQTFAWLVLSLGIPSLDLKEIKQVTTGNVLFYITAIFVAWVLTHGGCATVEHPQAEKPLRDASRSGFGLPTPSPAASGVLHFHLLPGLLGTGESQADDLSFGEVADVSPCATASGSP